MQTVLFITGETWIESDTTGIVSIEQQFEILKPDFYGPG